jgi:transcriptional regulator GlxA family with amidase domain
MVSVVIAALSGTASIGTAGLMDALNKADLAQALGTGRPAPRVFDVRLAGLDSGNVACRDGVSLHPSVTAANVTTPDLVVVPGLDDDLATSFAENRGWVPWLSAWHEAGARIAGSCTGAFLVADAGLLDGKPATTHWMFARELGRRYPAVNVTADRMIVDNGDVITSGGATAFLNLVLYLVERFAGHERANLAAKVLLVDGHRASQLPYIAFGRDRSHDDVIVHQVQQYIDLHLDEPLRISDLASSFRVSERTLSRRFAAATGRGPRAYLKHARIQHAMRLLETASDPIDLVRRRAGYSDPAAFRRVFKETTGLSPAGYRDAYGLHNGPGN